MRSPLRMPTRAVAALATSLLLLAACGDDDTTTTGPDPTNPDIGALIDLEVDWDARTVEGDAGEWTVEFCPGEAPFLCVSRDGDLVGSVELGTFDAPDGGLDAWVAGHYESLAADRRDTCEDGYAVDGDPPVPNVLGDHDGISYGYTASDGDGTDVERGLGHAAIVGDTLYLLTAHAYTDGSCVGGAEGEFSDVGAVEDFAPVLAALAAGSELPEPFHRPPADDGGDDGDDGDAAVNDGSHQGFFRSIDADGTVEFDAAELLSGDEARDAAREDGEIGEDEDLPNDFYVRDPSAEVVTLAVAADATVELVDCDAGCEPAAVDRDDFLSGESEAFNGPAALYEIEVVDGEIVSITEIYLP